MYKLKWENDLKMYINVFNSFILEGNINDLQPTLIGNRYDYVTLKEAIAKEYSDKYTIVFYDHTKMAGRELNDENSSSNTISDDDINGPSNDNNLDETLWFNSFVFYDDSKRIKLEDGRIVPSDNITLMKECYKHEYFDKISKKSDRKSQSDIAMDMQRIYDLMNTYNENKTENTKPFMFVLPSVSRYMTRPGSPSDSENPMLMILFNITQLIKTECKILLFVDKMNDLPTWFESENSNSAVKKIFVAQPDNSFREEFYNVELNNIMFPNDEDNIEERKTKFAAYTVGYSTRRLHQFKHFVEFGDNDIKDFTNIDKTILKFDIGENDDPWKNSELKNVIKNIDITLMRSIKGQDKAIFKVKTALEVAATGLKSSKKNDRRPKAVLMFAGPTGVGKTELAKQIAENVFKNQDNMIRFDMSEFKDEHTDSRLFGAPPGYVGYEAGGELTKAIKQRPFSVVLFDEIEKASPRIWDKFLQILGDGRLTDGKGETVSFTQSIIIFTSNLGISADANDSKINDSINNANTSSIDSRINSILAELKTITNIDMDANSSEVVAEKMDKKLELISKLSELELEKVPLVGLKNEMKNSILFKNFYKELGIIYRNEEYCCPTDAFEAFVERSVKERIYKYFERIGRREVLGRIGDDNILVFNFISEDASKNLAMVKINKFVSKLKDENDNHLILEVDESAKEYIIKEVTKPEVLNFGGRGIEDCVDKTLGEAIKNYILNNQNIEGKNIKLKCVNSRLIVE